MGKFYTGSIKIDYTDLQSCVQLCAKLGGAVVKYPERRNYNIAADPTRAVAAGAQIMVQAR